MTLEGPRPAWAASAVGAGALVLLGLTACSAGTDTSALAAASLSASAAAAHVEAEPFSTPRPTGVLGTASSTSTPGGGGSPTAPSAVATTPGGPYAGVPEGTAVAYDIPDATSVPPLLPAGYAPTLDLGQYRLEPVVPGQACSSRPPFNVAGRQWSWGEGQASVSLVVTGWRTGRGSAAFDDVLRDAGICRFMDEVHPFPVQVTGVQQAWAATADANGLTPVYGAARVGDLLVGVAVDDDSVDERELVAQLLQAVGDQLRTSGLPAATSSS